MTTTIRGCDWKVVRFESHQFRHTVGTRMINLGVPHHIIQHYLRHKGPEMASRYAHIHDVTMHDKFLEYLKGTLINVTGKAVPEEGMNDSADPQDPLLEACATVFPALISSSDDYWVDLVDLVGLGCDTPFKERKSPGSLIDV
jgi:hypothetical protein